MYNVPCIDSFSPHWPSVCVPDYFIHKFPHVQGRIDSYLELEVPF